MVKEGDLWDDSALINAFNHAISNYKKMHGKGYKENSSTTAVDDKISNSDGPTSFDACIDNNSSNPETPDQKKYNGSRAIPEVEDVESLETAKGIQVADSEVPGEHPLGSSYMLLQDQSQNYSISQDMDEYNQLYKQYYEVEEQRQQILQKMQKFNYWHNSYPSEEHDSGLHLNTSSATQGYQSSTSQLPCGTMVVSCCPCACQCFTASCSAAHCPLAGVSASNLCVGTLTTKDADIVETAMGAAERTLSTLKDITKDSEEKNEQNNVAEQNIASGTDLSTVLNAWYSAGFHTGKYLTEQSLYKKQNDSV